MSEENISMTPAERSFLRVQTRETAFVVLDELIQSGHLVAKAVLQGHRGLVGYFQQGMKDEITNEDLGRLVRDYASVMYGKERESVLAVLVDGPSDHPGDARRFRLFRVNDRTGSEVELTDPGQEPLRHSEAVAMLSKQVKWDQFPHLRNVLKEVSKS